MSVKDTRCSMAFFLADAHRRTAPSFHFDNVRSRKSAVQPYELVELRIGPKTNNGAAVPAMGWTLKKLAFAALANATMLVASVGVLFSIVKIGLLGTDFVATRVSENESSVVVGGATLIHLTTFHVLTVIMNLVSL